MAKLIARRRACETLVSPRAVHNPASRALARSMPRRASNPVCGTRRDHRCRKAEPLPRLNADGWSACRRSDTDWASVSALSARRARLSCYRDRLGPAPPPGARRAFSDATLCGNQIMGAAMRGSLCPIYANKPPLYGVKTFLTMITHIRCGPWSWVSNLQPARFAGAGFLMPRARTSSPRWAVKPLLNPEP